MTGLRVLFFVTLAVRGLDCVRVDLPWSSPILFYYKHDDDLNINLFLQNVSSRADRFVLYYQTENCDKNISEKYKQQGSQCDEPAQNGPIQTDVNIHTRRKLDKGSVRLYIELSNSTKVCSTKMIMTGLRDEHADKVDNKFRTACLNQYDRTCQINVDFGNKCQDQTLARMSCTQTHPRITCESPDEGLPQDAVHQWYQGYEDGVLVGTIPLVKGNKSIFKMEYLKFDYNTYIYSKMNSTHWKNDLNTEIFRIPSPRNGYKKYEVSRNETYSESDQFNFSCTYKANTQIGWINPIGDRITTYNTTTHSWNFTKTDNNSMLCCLHYNISTINYEAFVNRYIEAITVLIYEEPVNPDDIMANTRPEGNSSQEAQDHQQTESKSNPDQPPSAKTKYYIGIASVAGIIILISLMFVVIKKCCRKYSDPAQTLQFETYASTNVVLYAELDLSPGNAPPPASTEDPTYAEIIGVLRPQNENVKK